MLNVETLGIGIDPTLAQSGGARFEAILNQLVAAADRMSVAVDKMVANTGAGATKAATSVGQIKTAADQSTSALERMSSAGAASLSRLEQQTARVVSEVRKAGSAGDIGATMGRFTQQYKTFAAERKVAEEAMARDTERNHERMASTMQRFTERYKTFAAERKLVEEAKQREIDRERERYNQNESRRILAQQRLHSLAMAERQAAANRATQAESSGFGRLVSAIGLGTLAANLFSRALGSVYSNFANIIRTGIQFNATLETAELGLAAILRSFDASERARPFEASLTRSKETINELMVLARQVPATFTELLQGLQTGMGPMFSVGIKNTKEQLQVIAAFGHTMSSLGIPAWQMPQELRGLLSGDTSRISRVNQIIGLTKEEIDKATAAGTTYGLVMDKLSTFSEAGARSQQTFATQISNLRDNFEQLAAVGMQDLFKLITGAVKELTGFLGSDEAREKARGFGTVAVQMVEDIGRTIEKYKPIFELFSLGFSGRRQEAFTRGQADQLYEANQAVLANLREQLKAATTVSEKETARHAVATRLADLLDRHAKATGQMRTELAIAVLQTAQLSLNSKDLFKDAAENVESINNTITRLNDAIAASRKTREEHDKATEARNQSSKAAENMMGTARAEASGDPETIALNQRRIAMDAYREAAEKAYGKIGAEARMKEYEALLKTADATKANTAALAEYENAASDIKTITEFWREHTLIQQKSATETERTRRTMELQARTAASLYDPQKYAEAIGAWNAFQEERLRKQAQVEERIKTGEASLTEAFIAGLQKQAAAYGSFASQVSQLAGDITNAFATGLSTAISDVITGTKDAEAAFKDFAASFLNEISRMITKMLIQLAIQQLINAATGGGGNVFSAAGGGGVIAYAAGGPIHGPPHSSGGVTINAEGGEFILPQTAVRNEGIENLELLRRGEATIIKKYATGGSVEQRFGGSDHTFGHVPPYTFGPRGFRGDWDAPVADSGWMRSHGTTFQGGLTSGSPRPTATPGPVYNADIDTPLPVREPTPIPAPTRDIAFNPNDVDLPPISPDDRLGWLTSEGYDSNSNIYWRPRTGGARDTGEFFGPSNIRDTGEFHGPNFDQAAFEEWKATYAPNDSGIDYDFRAAYLAGVLPDESGHWPDTYKLPNHPTFSDESIYAEQNPDAAGHWVGDTYIPPGTEMANFGGNLSLGPSPFFPSLTALGYGTGYPSLEGPAQVLVNASGPQWNSTRGTWEIYNPSAGDWRAIDSMGSFTGSYTNSAGANVSTTTGAPAPGMTVVGRDTVTGAPVYRDSQGNYYVPPGVGTAVSGTGGHWDYGQGRYVSGLNATGAQFNSRAANAALMSSQAFGGNPNNMASAAFEGRFLLNAEGGVKQWGKTAGFDLTGAFRMGQKSGAPTGVNNTEAYNSWMMQQPEYIAWAKAHGYPGYGEGGLVLPAGVFTYAERMHNGGTVGMEADEVPIVAKRGERVVTPEQWNNLAPSQNTTNVFNINTTVQANGQTRTETSGSGGPGAEETGRALNGKIVATIQDEIREGGSIYNFVKS